MITKSDADNLKAGDNLYLIDYREDKVICREFEEFYGDKWVRLKNDLGGYSFGHFYLNKFDALTEILFRLKQKINDIEKSIVELKQLEQENGK